MNKRISSIVRLLLLLVTVCVALNACVTPKRPGAAGDRPPARAAQQMARRGDYARAAELYALAARRQARPAQRAEMHLRAAIAALRAQRFRLADKQHAAINPSHLSQTGYRSYRLIGKLLNIESMPPEKALAQLPPPPPGIPPDLAAYVWKSRAQLLFAQYRYVAGIHNLVQRSVWLLDERAVRQNNRLIFERALQAVRLGRGPDSPAARQAGATTLGWLRLAEIKLHGPDGRAALQQALNQWEDRFTGHPATGGVLLSVFNYNPYSSPQPRPYIGDGVQRGPVALVLPLSGNIAEPARAIRAGFEMARANSNASRPLVIIDSTGMSAGEIVQRARAKGAALIVGPLKKSKVRALASQAPRIPVLALNQVQGISAPPWFYRYALAPEDDARTVAAYAASRGWERALALIPDSSWGSRVLNAFANAFSRYGGTLVDYASFVTSRYDHEYAVQSVLQGYHSGVPVDFVFMAARPAHARLLRSQLRFYHAAKLPVVATSGAYSGVPAPRKDMDLNGVGFAAMPWIIGAGGRLRALHRQAEARAGIASRRFPQLFAMGIDAWRLASRLARSGLAAGMTMEGVTGVLEVKPSGRIRRHLAWARFVDGRAQLVAPASAGSPDTFGPRTRAMQPDRRGPRQPASRRRDFAPVHAGGGHAPSNEQSRAGRRRSATGQYGPVYSGTADSPTQ